MKNNSISLVDESKNQGGFYVPRFEIKIEEAGLPKDVLLDVLECTYNDNIDKIDSFELTINNWDAEKNVFKYIGSETGKELKNGSLSQRHQLFEPCGKEVKIYMGYSGDLRHMITGTFTTMEPSFPRSGGATLRVRGLNIMHQMRRRQYSDHWKNMGSSQIVKDIAKKRDKKTKQPRLRCKVITSKNKEIKEAKIPYIAQHNQYDIDFILGRAKEEDYVFVVCEPDDKDDKKKGKGTKSSKKGKVSGKKKEIELYFGPSDEVPYRRNVTFELAWGTSLVDFKPTLTTANQIKSVTVKGWNRKTGKPIKKTASLDNAETLKQCNKRNLDLTRLLLGKRCDSREEYVVDEPVYTEKQAWTKACSILANRQKQMVKASGTTVGLPDLRAGQKIIISNVGSRLSGSYFVTETTHKINGSGYITTFKARREEKGKKKS